MRFHVISALVPALLAFAPVAAAAKQQPIHPEATRHYERARALLTLGQLREAIPEFEEAFIWSSRPDMLYNIALAYRKLAEQNRGDEPAARAQLASDLRAGLRYFRRYLAAVPLDPDASMIREWMAEMERRAAAAEEPPRALAKAPRIATGDGVPAGVRVLEAGLALGVALGAVGIGLGGKLLSDDGRPTCTLVPPERQCPELLSTRGQGLALLVPGIVLALGGAAGLVATELRLARRGRRGASDKKAWLVPVVGADGAGLALVGAL